MLTREAFNALLKTMEEPPAHVKFILCTTEPHKVPATIQSRCQRFDFRAIPTAAHRRAAAARSSAQEGIEADDDVIAAGRPARPRLDARRAEPARPPARLGRDAADARGPRADARPARSDAGRSTCVDAIAERRSRPAALRRGGASCWPRGTTVEQALELLTESTCARSWSCAACGTDSDLLELPADGSSARRRPAPSGSTPPASCT